MTATGGQPPPTDGIAARVWARDTGLWTADAAAAKEVAERLGWLDLPSSMRSELPRLREFAAAVAADGIDRVLVCGMGGSSLCVEVLARVVGVQPGWLEVRVLDSTHPDAVAAAAAWATPERSLYLIASKSGTTTEPNDFAAFFEHHAAGLGADAGRHFAAITDPDTPLVEQAGRQDWRQVFENPPDIGGRYSALSLFGLVPAALLGIDLDGLLGRAAVMATACGPEVADDHNPAVRLGRFMAEQALAGRDKLTLLTPPALASFGLWVEQLLAESTGKQGTGVLPVVGEKPGPAVAFGADRAVVAVGYAGQDPPGAKELAAAGQPLLELDLPDPLGLGGAFFQWELATAVAGHLLGINAFDQPDVQAAKDATKRVLGEVGGDPAALPAADVRLAVPADVPAAAAALRELLGGVAPPEYVAIQAYLDPDGPAAATLEETRTLLRDATTAAVTVGFGPRFLHSTGQFHKGGPNTGRFVQLTDTPAADLEVPGRAYTFGTLVAAQAAGDAEALRAKGRRVVRVHLDGQQEAGALLREAVGVALGVAGHR